MALRLAEADERSDFIDLLGEPYLLGDFVPDDWAGDFSYLLGDLSYVLGDLVGDFSYLLGDFSYSYLLGDDLS